MPPAKPSFEDRVAVISAELGELGKRPVSGATYSEVVILQERLDDIVSEFILCEGCAEMFPVVVQVTIEDDTATLCRECAISAIQRDTFSPSGDGSKRSKSRRTPGTAAGAKRPKASAKGAAGDDAASAAGARTRSRPRSKSSGPSPSDGEEEATPGTPQPTTDAASPEPSDVGDGLLGVQEEASGPFEVEQSPSVTSVDDVLSAPRARSPRPPKSEEPVLKATFAATARHLDRDTREVRQVGKLVEEISPPMDVEKTTRYVLAELRNKRSKIPREIVPKIVSVLKEGIPGGTNGDGDS